MAQQTINHGSVADDGTGESPFSGMQKVNANFTELYAAKDAQAAALAAKAPLDSPTFTGTVNGITKAMVGLGNVDNVSDANKPVSTPQNTAIVAGDNLRLRTGDVYEDFIASGLTIAVPLNSLVTDIVAGVAYAGGIRFSVSANLARTFTALRDTYVEVDSSGALNYHEKANGVAPDAVPVGSLRFAKVVSGATAITAVTEIAPRVQKSIPVMWNSDGSGVIDRITGKKVALVKNDMSKVAMVGNSIANNCFSYAVTSTRWWPSTVFGAGSAVVPLTYKGIYPGIKYVSSGGTSAAGFNNEPVWPETIGSTVQDGSITWTATAEAAADYSAPIAANYWFWAQAMSGQRLRECYIVGLSGRRIHDIATLKDRVNATGAGVIFMPSPLCNDIWAGGATTDAQVIAAYAAWEALCEEWRLAGKKLILTTELPNGNIDTNNTAFTDYQTTRGATKRWYWVNQRILDYARKNSSSVILLDLANIYRDTNVANPVWPDNTTTYVTINNSTVKLTDAIHPKGPGAFLIGKALAKLIIENFPPIDHFGNGALNPYDADTNPANYGTGGTYYVLGVLTGGATVSNNMMLAVNGGTAPAAASSKIPRTDGVPGAWQRAVYSATAGDTLSYYNSTPIASLPKFTVGSYVELITEMKILANPVGLCRIGGQVRFSGATTPQWLNVGVHESAEFQIGQFITEDTVFTFRGPAMKIPSGVTSIGVWQSAYSTGQANPAFTADFGRRTLRLIDTTI